MTSKPKGSTPGPYITRNLSNVSSINSPAALSVSVVNDSPNNEKAEVINDHTQYQSQACSILSDDGNVYPEGGWEAWSVVFGSFCGMMASLGTMNTIGVFQAYISEHQLSSYTESEISWIFSVYSFLSFFGGVQVGPYFDARGPKLLVFLGSLFLVASILILGVCESEDCPFWIHHDQAY